jgi:fibro-slime domain-containing protein
LSPNRALGLAVVLACFASTLGAFGCAKVGGAERYTGMAGDGTAGFDGGAAGTVGAGGIGGNAGTSAPDAAEEAPVYATCGNSIKESGETCDDGNKVSGDGCGIDCRIEANYTCPTVGKACVHNVVCGDHLIEGTEECDDGNTAANDGCSPTCTLDCGWECPPSTLCRALKCGDGMVAGNEQCDDGNVVDGDGCSKDCLLEGKPIAVAEGWVCTSPKAATGTCVGPTTCTTTVCGNGKTEGSEQCDDGNDVVGDGCSPFCRLEPKCPAGGGACMSLCGDGLLLPSDIVDPTNCDDGNTVDGDGCSHLCKVEAGFTCPNVMTTPTQLVLPIVYHDFKDWKEVGGHPDFGHYQGTGRGVPGIAKPILGAMNVPEHVAMCTALTTNLCTAGDTTDWFAMWYLDNLALPAIQYNKTIVKTLTLPQVMGKPGTFQYGPDENFFPLDGLTGTWGLTPGSNPPHDFSFTSATRTWFEYEGAATLTFVGDDDVWVYINKKLAVDLGGTHTRNTGSITLDATNGHGTSCDFVAPGTDENMLGACAAATPPVGGHDIDLGLAKNGLYEIVVFQAERFQTESHYQLTLSGFTGVKSSCVSACGDGVVTAPEICDKGMANNTGAYGGCNKDCTLAPYCGDKIVTSPQEECDGNGNCDKNCKVMVVQ